MTKDNYQISKKRIAPFLLVSVWQKKGILSKNVIPKQTRRFIISNRTEKVISFSIIKWNKTLCPIPLQTKIWHWLPALFEPDKDQIPQIMERIFLQYYKLYNKSNSVNFIPKYDYIPMTKGNGIKEDKAGED